MHTAEKEKLIIIGAGAAGLMAANELAGAYDIIILEALPRTGGRIHTLHDDTEAGAEFVHGDLPLTMELVKKAGATLEKVAADRFSVDQCQWTQEEEMIDGWELLLNKMGQLKEDLTIDAFLETCFSGSEYEKLRHSTRAYTSGFDLADPVRASTMALYREWSAESEHIYRIKQGYQAIIHYLGETCKAKGVQILLHQKVSNVQWQHHHVTVHTETGEQYNAGKLVVTIPAGVHQQSPSPCHIRFEPALNDYEEHWKNIGYGSVMKLLLRFKRPFWKPASEHGFILSAEPIPTWWTNGNLVTGWIGGPAALQWDLIDDQQIIEQAIVSLSRIFRVSGSGIIDELLEHHIARWHTYPSFLGGYSYETPYSREAKAALRKPVQDTIYFAGEALYDGDASGTVEAALHNGKAVAESLFA